MAEFINGFAFKPQDWGQEGLPIIRIQDLTGNGKESNRTLREVPQRYHVNKGDLLVSWSASLGVYEWAGSDALVNQHIFKVVPDTQKVDKDYLRHALDASIHRMDQFTHGSTMKHINRKEFLEHAIPLPPLDEQRRIVAILDKADTLRRKRKRALALLDSLTQSIFLDMFGGGDRLDRLTKVRLQDVLMRIDSGWSPVCLNRLADEQEAGVLKLSCISRSGYLPSENKALPSELAPKEALEVKADDVLFARKNTKELVGSSVYVWETRPRLFLSDLIFRLRPKLAVLDPLFLQVQLNTSRKRKELSELAGGVAGSMPNISKTRLSDLEISLPSLASQAAFRTSCEASRNRLRPITMTTLAAILTLAPLALSIGQGSAIQQPLAIAIISGLTLQFPLVLLVMPVIIALTLPRGA